jgi:site-specific DNA recombinase
MSAPCRRDTLSSMADTAPQATDRTRKRAVIYARVASDSQGPYAAWRQVEQCKALCKQRNWDVVEIHQEISASANSTEDRPAWLHVLELARTGQVDVIVAWDLARITRSTVVLEELISLGEEHNVDVATVSGDIDLTSPEGRMVARTFAALAHKAKPV